MLTELVRLGLGGVLIGAAAAKLASPASSRAALATFGIDGARTRLVVWLAVIAAEVGLGAAILAGSDAAALLAAALMALFGATTVGAIMRGRAGAPCACFGARSRVGWRAVARNVALAAALIALPFLPEADLSTDEWLGVGLIVALLLCAGLAVAVLALAREVGMLRLRLGPGSALEIEEEGPALGSRVDLGGRFGDPGEAVVALAVFTSPGCRICRSLEPAIASLASHPLLSLEVFDEVEDADVWRRLEVPGSPFALALERDGTVLAKGTFNDLAQLESVVATAEHRRARGLGVGTADG